MKKLKLWNVLCALMFVALAVQSCKSDDDGANYQMENQTFVTQAINSNQFEIEAGTIAQRKSTNSQIKQLSAHMVADHTGVKIDLTDLAKSMELVVPANLDIENQGNINTLELLTGSTFDREYIRIMIESHQKAITLFQNASGNTGVAAADLRNFAGNKVPNLQSHLKEAQSLSAAVQ